jgi:hypothetical protein
MPPFTFVASKKRRVPFSVKGLKRAKMKILKSNPIAVIVTVPITKMKLGFQRLKQVLQLLLLIGGVP